jgi:hypothetical protein
MQDNVVDIDDHRRPDPILRVGDVVRLVQMDHYFKMEWENGHLDSFPGSDFYEGKLGTVTRICMVLPPSHCDAPGQATYVDVRVIHPSLSDEEEFLDAISTLHLRRVYGRTAAMRGGDVAVVVTSG